MTSAGWLTAKENEEVKRIGFFSRWKGNGSNSMSFNIPLFNSTKCAVVANEVSDLEKMLGFFLKAALKNEKRDQSLVRKGLLISARYLYSLYGFYKFWRSVKFKVCFPVETWRNLTSNSLTLHAKRLKLTGLSQKNILETFDRNRMLDLVHRVVLRVLMYSSSGSLYWSKIRSIDERMKLFHSSSRLESALDNHTKLD